MYAVTSYDALSGAYLGTLYAFSALSARHTYAVMVRRGRSVRLNRIDGYRSALLAEHLPPDGA